MSEERILTDDPDNAFVATTDGQSVTGEAVVIDGTTEKSVVRTSRWAGASSTAAANSGVPSAQIQHGIKQHPHDEAGGTPLADRFDTGSRSSEL